MAVQYMFWMCVLSISIWTVLTLEFALTVKNLDDSCLSQEIFVARTLCEVYVTEIASFCKNTHAVRLAVELLMVLLLAGGASAAENEVVTTSSHEFALLGGYGITHRGYGETRTQVETFDLILRYGYFLSDEVGKGRWYQGRHQVLLELPWHCAVDHNGRSMVGATILGSWTFTWSEQVTPYLFAGGGVLFVDLGLPTMGSKLNGTYQAGGGIQHFFNKDTAFFGEYRYHHISNLNTSSPNEPLNSSKFLIGLSYYL
jgi:opacity protein-like surface antigen